MFCKKLQKNYKFLSKFLYSTLSLYCVFRGERTFSDTVLNSTEIYNFWAIFGKKYLPVLNCTKLNFKSVPVGTTPTAMLLLPRGHLDG